MSKFTHAVCDRCWTERNPKREPYRLKDPDVCTCCSCGKPTRSGIFVRGNPEDYVHCVTTEEHHA